MGKASLSLLSVLLGLVVSVLPAQLVSGIDLVVSVGPISEITALADDSVSIQVIVQNLGITPTSADASLPTFNVALYLVTDETLPDELLDTASMQVPVGGGTATVDFSFNAPHTPGYYYLYASVDRDDVIAETNEQNNYSEIITLEVIEPPEAVGPSPDLRVTEIYVTGGPIVVADDRMFLNFTAQNAGDASTQMHEEWEAGGFTGRFELAVYQYFQDPDTGVMEFQTRIDLDFGRLDFADPTGFVQSLQPPDPNEYDERDPFSIWVFDHLPATLQDMIRAYDETAPPSRLLQTLLASELDVMIKGGYLGYNLYEVAPCDQIELTLDTEDLIDREPQGENLAHLNRTLLEEAYPSEIRSHLHGPLEAQGTLGYGWSFPAPSIAGTYYYVVAADRADRIMESNEFNNWGNFLLVQVIEPQLDLIVASTTITSRQDTTIEVNVVVENITDVARIAVYRVLLYLFTDPILGPLESGQVVGEHEVIANIKPRWSQLVNLSFELPDPAQTYYLVAYVEIDATAGITEADQTNNWGKTLTLQGPDLQITDIDIVPSDYSDMVRVAVRVANFGNYATGDGFDVDLFLLSDPDADLTGLTPLFSRFMTPLEAGDSKTLITLLTLPDPTGTYYLTAVADRGELIAEADESNNHAQAVVQGPDLQISDSELLQSDYGGTIQVKVTVNNVGDLATAASFDVGLYLLSDPNDDLTGQAPAVSQSVGQLSVDDSETLTMSFAAPEAIGTYYLTAVADQAAVIADTDGSNNRGENLILSLQAPDLQITHSEILASDDASTIQVAVTVANVGNDDCDDSFDVDLYLITDPAVDLTGQTPQASDSIISLAVNETQTLYISFTVPAAVGSYYVTAVADQAAVIAEADRSNNRGENLALQTAAGGLSVRRMSVKADKDRSSPWDSFTIAGAIDGTFEELSASGVITVRLATPQADIYTETIDVQANLVSSTSGQATTDATDSAGGIGINWSGFSGLLGVGGTINGRVSAEADGDTATFRYQDLDGSGISSLVLRLKQSWQKGIGAFQVAARKVDLTELTSPITLEISFGDYRGRAVVDESVINGSQPVSLLFLSGVADAVSVDRAVVNRRADGLLVTGAIAAQTLEADLPSKEVTVTWGLQSFIIPVGSFQSSRPGTHKFICRRGTIISGGSVNATLDLDQATFRISITNSFMAISQPAAGQNFGIAFEGFSAETLIN